MSRSRTYQIFKYAVYAFLTANIFLFFAEEWAAVGHRFAAGISLAEIHEAFAASIDTAAWVVLLLMFELETFVLDDRHFTRRVILGLHLTRILAYIVIVIAFAGYTEKLLFVAASEPLAGISGLCGLVDGTWSYAVDFDEYEVLTAANCAAMSTATTFFQFPGIAAAVDAEGLSDIVWLAWVDVINAGVWLLVVLLLEIDVRLQERHLLQGTVLKISTASKFVLYGTLVLAAGYWSVNGDFIDSWDAWLWLVAFVFIELNVFDWRQEDLEEMAAAGAGST